ncbi:uncharacterized protein BYT42DRAFT_611596 [Radiomyces spectabilis]|uniref:uncharacterized protein n=1 Tax=Radiomyces spectabilis TaxID=64574 RepID=UPI00221EAF4A|nr:uncharacterized protein BYT42DRAFT_611596 [Radiomyces spectabilis]KAI8388565.1 hypothetical protein BYT42DRAFT_611596 [Radiomyces spectabilis]
MLRLILLFTVFCLWWVPGYGQLRKHHQQIQPPLEEVDVIRAMQGKPNEAHRSQEASTNMPEATYASSPASTCGEASLSCVVFDPKHSRIPIRCGVIRKAPVCERQDDQGKRHCDVFCDADGGARVCEFAFPKCCAVGKNGCRTSKPRESI